MNRKTTTIALILPLAALAGTASAQLGITSYAPPAGTTLVALKSMTPDGSSAVGFGQTPGGTTLPVRWSTSNGLGLLTNNANWHDAGAQCVSPDGAAIYGYMRFSNLDYKMVSWINFTRTEYINLPAALVEVCPQAMDAAAANIFGWVVLSAGGDIKAARIKANTQDYVLLDQTFTNNALSARSYVCDVSDNGLVATGNAWSNDSARPVRWTLTPNGTSTMQELGLLSGGTSGYANASSSDGSVIVGRGGTPSGDRAWQWRLATGMVQLESLAGEALSAASNVSSNGRIVTGYASVSGADRGRFWINGEAHDFINYMQDRGIDMTGWSVAYPDSTNNDGSIIAGHGKFNNLQRTFIAHIRCVADLDFDASVDLADFFAFFNAFDTSANLADLNTDGSVDLVDYFDFLNHFDSGC